MSYHRDPEHLFCSADLRDMLQGNLDRIRGAIDSVPEDQFIVSLDEDLAGHFLDTYHIEPIVLREDHKEMEKEEVQVDVSHNRDRNVFGRRGPIYINGIRLTISIPFTGRAELWRLRPMSYFSVFPIGRIMGSGGIDDGTLDIVIEQPSDQEAQQIAAILEDNLDLVRKYLKNQSNQIEGYHQNLPMEIMRAITARRERLKTHDQIVASLDIPLKRRDGAPSTIPIKMTRKMVRPLPPP